MAKMSLAGDLKVYSEQYQKAVALAGEGAGVPGSVIDTGTGGQSGGICIKAVAHGAVSIAADKVLTIAIKDGEASDSVAAKYTFTVTGAKEYADKELIVDYVLPPSIKRWTGVTVTSDDAAAVGAIDVYPVYLPR